MKCYHICFSLCFLIGVFSLAVGREDELLFDWTRFTSHEVFVNIDADKAVSIKHVNRSSNSIISSDDVPSGNDRLVSVNGLPLLSTSLAEMLAAKISRIFAIPIVDDEKTMNNGYHLLGFASIQLLSPKDVVLRRTPTVNRPTSETKAGRIDEIVDPRVADLRNNVGSQEEVRSKINQSPLKEKEQVDSAKNSVNISKSILLQDLIH